MSAVNEGHVEREPAVSLLTPSPSFPDRSEDLVSECRSTSYGFLLYCTLLLVELAARRGFEPRSEDPKSSVLPIDERAKMVTLRGLEPRSEE